MNKIGRFSPLGNFVIAENGVFLEVGTPIFQTRFMYHGELSLKQISRSRIEHSTLTTDFTWLAPPAPSGLLHQAIGYFRAVMAHGGAKQVRGEGGGLKEEGRHGDIPYWLHEKDHSELHQMEALVWMTYRKDEGWQIRVPPQSLTAARVNSVPITPHDNVAIVLHSHGRWHPIWSATDNSDETDGFVYGVIGNLHTHRPTISLRVGYANQFLRIRKSDVFAN